MAMGCMVMAMQALVDEEKDSLPTEDTDFKILKKDVDEKNN